MKKLILITLCIYFYTEPGDWLVQAHNNFTRDGCLAIHNALRKRHADTNAVTYDVELESSARLSATFLSSSSNSEKTEIDR